MSLAMASSLGSVAVAGSSCDMFSALFLLNIVVVDVGIGFVVVDIDVDVAASVRPAAAAAVEAAAAACVAAAPRAAGSAADAAAGGVGAAASAGVAAGPAAAVGAAAAAAAPVVAAAVGAAAAAAVGVGAADSVETAAAVVAPAAAEAAAGAAAAGEAAFVIVAMMGFAVLIPYPMGACMLLARLYQLPISTENPLLWWMMAFAGAMMWYSRRIGHPLLQRLLAYLHPMNILWVRSSVVTQTLRENGLSLCSLCSRVQSSFSHGLGRFCVYVSLSGNNVCILSVTVF